jgi:hypothetical protein
MAFDTKATQLFKDITNACKYVIMTQMKGGLGNWVLTDGKRIFGNIYMNSARILYRNFYDLIGRMQFVENSRIIALSDNDSMVIVI